MSYDLNIDRKVCSRVVVRTRNPIRVEEWMGEFLSGSLPTRILKHAFDLL